MNLRKTLLVLLFALFAGGCANTLITSDAQIREHFLQNSPIGMPIGAFREQMAARKTPVYQEWVRYGRQGIPPGRTAPMGDRVLWVKLGEYQGVKGLVYVSAFVGFTDGILTDCVIDKSTEAP